MQRVEITDGLKYGFQIMGYYLGVALAGSLLSAFGVFLILFEIISEFGAAAEAPAADPDPSVALLLVGLLLTIVGVLVVWAGLFGSLYKIVADAVAKGEYLAELTEHDPAAEMAETDANKSTTANGGDASDSTVVNGGDASDSTTADDAASGTDNSTDAAEEPPKDAESN